MVDKNKEIKLTNRDNGEVGYTIPDLRLHRSFTPGETKTVTFNEIEQLAWSRGGLQLLKHYLIIQDKEAAEEILGRVEPEYYYTKDTVKTLLTEGTLEQLQDTLEFAPKGVIDLVKKEAVDLPVNNVAMRDEILKKTNFNVDKAVEIKKASLEDGAEEETTSTRRAAPVTAKVTETGRKAKPIIITK